MDVIVPAIILLGLLFAWTYLPFHPAVRELAEKKDIQPVRVVRDSEVDVHFFARGYRRFLAEHFAKPLTRRRAKGVIQKGQLDDGTAYVVLGGNKKKPTLVKRKHRSDSRMILSRGSLRLAAATVYRMEIYAAESVYGDEGSVYRGILAENRIELAPESTSLRWMHAGGTISVGEDSWLHGRVSADERIELADRCHFERLNAPRIEFGGNAAPTKSLVKSAPLEPRDLRNVVDVAAGRWLCKGQLRVPGARSVEADLVSTGSGRVDDGTRIAGSIKCHKDLSLGRGVVVHGSVVAGRDLHLGAGCRIHGPVLAERTAFIGRNCKIGSVANPTTVSARRIRVESPVMMHGSVWAHQEGRVGGGALSET